MKNSLISLVNALMKEFVDRYEFIKAFLTFALKGNIPPLHLDGWEILYQSHGNSIRESEQMTNKQIEIPLHLFNQRTTLSM